MTKDYPMTNDECPAHARRLLQFASLVLVFGFSTLRSQLRYVARVVIIDPCAANEPPPETFAIGEEGVSGGGTGPIRSAEINSH